MTHHRLVKKFSSVQQRPRKELIWQLSSDNVMRMDTVKWKKEKIEEKMKMDSQFIGIEEDILLL